MATRGELEESVMGETGEMGCVANTSSHFLEIIVITNWIILHCPNC